MITSRKMKTDVLIIGSGGAGLRAAISASDAGQSVLLISKGKIGSSGATVTAIADVSVDSRSAKEKLGVNGDDKDSPEVFAEDIIKGGYNLSDSNIVDRFVYEIPKRIEEIVHWGAKIRNFSISPGHRYPRAVIINGRDFAMTLLKQVKSRSNISILANTVALDLYLKDGCVCGAWALDMNTGEYISISAGSVVIATGGAMSIFPVTTSPNDLLGDGIAMALRAGADLRDMEFQTFMLASAAPAALYGNNYPYVLVCRCGAHIYNREGERFLIKTDPDRMEKTTRDKLAIAVSKEILEGRGGPNGGVWVSIKHIPDNLFSYYQQWYESGLGFEIFDPKSFLPDLSKNAIESVPAAHFWCGGITITSEGATSIPGLYAAGECTGGLHGANRLSGDAMAEIIALGCVAGESAANYSSRHIKRNIPDDTYFEKAESLLQANGPEDAVEIRKTLQTSAWQNAGPLRNASGLNSALSLIYENRNKIDQIGITCHDRIFNREWMEALSLQNICDCSESLALSALERHQSLGSHFRSDSIALEEKPYVVHIKNDKNRLTSYRKTLEE